MAAINYGDRLAFSSVRRTMSRTFGTQHLREGSKQTPVSKDGIYARLNEGWGRGFSVVS